MQRFLGLLFCFLVIVFTPGCNDNGLWDTLGSVNAYTADVSNEMDRRGFPGFPDNPVMMVRWVAALKESIAIAGSGKAIDGVQTAMVKSNPDPPLQSLGDAFNRPGEW